MELQPFTKNERELAESCHDLVYQFLRAKKYPIEDYYNIAVMGYLKGIQKYYRSGDIDETDLSGTCWNCMRSEVGNHLQMKKAKKRQPAEIPLQNIASPEEETLLKEKMEEVISELSDRQMEIIRLKLIGYSNVQVCSMLEMSKSTYYRELNYIRQKLETED